MEENKSHKKVKVIEILNEDVLEQVMLLLPVKSLLRLQTVSKHWRRMITSKPFKERYMLHQKTQDPRILCFYTDRSWDRKNTALKTMRLEWSNACLVEEEEEDEDHIIDDKVNRHYYGTPSQSIDGLVCFYASLEDLTLDIKVINPSTRWCYKLRLVKVKSYDRDVPFPGFGKDYVTGTYKIVWLHYCSSYKGLLTCDVFDLRLKQWRKVMTPIPHDLSFNNKNLPTFANGWLYWFQRDLTKLIAFDLHEETLQVIPNPIIETQSSPILDMHIGTNDDVLWASETNGDGIQHVWRLTNHNTRGALFKVDKMFSFDLNKFPPTAFFDPHYTCLFFIEAISKNGREFMISKADDNLFLLKPLNTTQSIFSFSSLCPSGSILRPFFPSLVSPM